MKYVWQFGLGLVLIVTQTTILPYFGIFDSIYDLLCPLVVYLGLFQPVSNAVPVILFYGFLMDNLSGAPPGFYLTSYIWLLIYAVALSRFMDLKNKLIQPFIVALGVVIENCLNLSVIMILTPSWWFSSTIAWQIAWQVVWVIAVTPFLFTFLNRIHAYKPSG